MRPTLRRSPDFHAVVGVLALFVIVFLIGALAIACAPSNPGAGVPVSRHWDDDDHHHGGWHSGKSPKAGTGHRKPAIKTPRTKPRSGTGKAPSFTKRSR